MILHGDPMIRMSYSGGKTDYAILEGIKAEGFNGQELTSDIDSFQLSIPIANLGLTSADEISLQVIREEPFYQEFIIKKYTEWISLTLLFSAFPLQL